MAHINYRLDLTAEVFIVYDGKVLLRKHDKYKRWLSVGGHVDPNEDPCEAAVREAKEEVGLDIELLPDERAKTFDTENFKILPRPEYVNRHRINQTHDHATFVYFARAKTDKLILSETEKSDECRWLTKEDINENPEISPEIKHFAKLAIDKVSEKQH